MKKRLKFKILTLFILGSLFLTGCEKDKKDSGLPKDGDGNRYETVVIGTQVWLTENLKTTKFNNGTAVRLITDDYEWTNTSLPVYCWFENNPNNKHANGALYNWYAGGLDLLCPVGYHVPTRDEWLVLINAFNSSPDEVKQSFKPRQFGFRVWNGSFTTYGSSWWVSSRDGSSSKVSNSFTIGGMPKNTGYSVRCIKDN